LNGRCKVVYDDDSDTVTFEEVDLHQLEWKPCSKRARKFVPFSSKPATVRANWKPTPKLAALMDRSIKGYADDATLISSNFDHHSSVLKEIYKRAANLDLMLKPSKYVLFLFDGIKHLSQGIALSNGTTRLRWNKISWEASRCVLVSNQNNSK